MNIFSRTRAHPFCALAGVALLALSGAAMAAPTLAPGSTTTDPTGIDNLVIDGTTYDVTLSTTSFDTTFPYPPSVAGTDAATAIANAFNALGVTDLGGSPDRSHFVMIENDASPTLADCAAQTPTYTSWIDALCGDFQLGDDLGAYSEAAHFSVVSSSVPEPATLALFGLGLAGIGLMKRRRRAR